MDDREAYEFYKNPEHLKIAGPGHKPKRPAKSSMVPVRFTPEMVERVKRIADAGGMTVSAWIRRAVQREVERAERVRPTGLIPGSARMGESRAIPSSLGLGGGHTFACQHMSIGGVLSASCAICGPLSAVA